MIRASIFTKDGRNQRTFRKAFTLVELLVVISIIALLLAILMPSLQKARIQAQTVVCGAQMRQYGFAVVQYATDNTDKFPPYCNIICYSSAAWKDNSIGAETVWINTLASYLGGEKITSSEARKVKNEKAEKNRNADFRLCSSKKAWVGAIYAPTKTYNSAFFIEDDGANTAWKYSAMRNQSGWAMLMDTANGWGMYSPLYHEFDYDEDLDDIFDTRRSCGYAYNDAAPKIHGGKSNIVLVDGHVKTMTFRDFQDPKNTLWGAPVVE